MNCDIILLFKYMEGRTTAEETKQAEQMLAENAECREHYDRMKPALDAMRPFWPRRDICPSSWNLMQYLHKDLKDPDMIRSIEEHIEGCRFCRSIKESFDEYESQPDRLDRVKARDLTAEAKKKLEELKGRF